MALITVLAATLVVGLIVGGVEGRRRYRFGQGRIVCVIIVGLTAPWALLLYAIGYGIGRLLPTPKPTPVALAYQHGWQTAVQLYAALATGHRPPTITAPGIVGAGFFNADTICHPLRSTRRSDARSRGLRRIE